MNSGFSEKGGKPTMEAQHLTFPKFNGGCITSLSCSVDCASLISLLNLLADFREPLAPGSSQSASLVVSWVDYSVAGTKAYTQ